MANPAFGPATTTGDQPADIQARGRIANDHMYDKIYYTIYFSDYHLTMVSLYGFHQKKRR